MEDTTPNTQPFKKPRTPAQIEASRNNGKKSKGPITEKGKAMSSLNSYKHGCSSKHMVTANECPSAYDGLLGEYFEQWQPANPTERDLVGQMAHAQYTLRRLFAMEAGFMDFSMEQLCPTLPAATDEPMRQTIAFKALADSSNGLTNLNRYLARTERLYHRALHTLLDLRKYDQSTNGGTARSGRGIEAAEACPPHQIPTARQACPANKLEQTNPSPTPPGGHLPWTDPRNRTSEAIHLRMTTPNLPPLPGKPSEISPEVTNYR